MQLEGAEADSLLITCKVTNERMLAMRKAEGEMKSRSVVGKCLICGGKLGKILLNITQPDRFEKAIGIDGKYLRRWVECSVCGTASNIMKQSVEKALAKISSSYYDYEFKTANMLRARYDKVMGLPPNSSDNYHRVRRIEGFINRYSVAGDGMPYLLDIGAGMGVFLSVFHQRNRRIWKTCGMEPDAMAARHLRSISNRRFTVIESRLEDYSPAAVKYKLCTLNKILEHIKKPVPFLGKIGGMLDDNGFVYLEMPDKTTIRHRPSTDNILGSLHHYLFDFKGMGILLEKAGFIPLSIEREFEPSGKITIYAFAAKKMAVNMLANEVG